MKDGEMSVVYLLVTIDTEEDQWGYRRSRWSVDNIRLVPEVQDIFNRYGVRPVYLCTTPVVEDTDSRSILETIFQKGLCEIGTHLHPWNSPPLREENNEYNSQLKNLSRELAEEKLVRLTGKIKECFHCVPLMFRAGRWGADGDVWRLLHAQGYRIDTSVTPCLSWTRHGFGADYANAAVCPSGMTPQSADGLPGPDNQTLYEFPVSIGFNRTPFEFWRRIDRLARRYPLRYLRMSGLLHHTGILKRIVLSPEESSAAEMLTLVSRMISSGINIINFTFHSTTLLPGGSPFVSSEGDRKAFLGQIESFLHELYVSVPVLSVTTPDILRLVDQGRIRVVQGAPLEDL